MINKYPSRYSPNKEVTAAQYIIELICEKKARFDKTELPMKFWQLEVWQDFFKRNLRKVHSLLKQFEAKSIINALNLPEYNNSYSVFTERFMGLVKQEQARLKQKSSISSIPNPTNRRTINSKPREPKVKENIINKLKDLDGTIN